VTEGHLLWQNKISSSSSLGLLKSCINYSHKFVLDGPGLTQTLLAGTSGTLEQHQVCQDVGAKFFKERSNWLTTPWAIKKRATFIFTITLANVDRFQ